MRFLFEILAVPDVRLMLSAVFTCLLGINVALFSFMRHMTRDFETCVFAFLLDFFFLFLQIGVCASFRKYLQARHVVSLSKEHFLEK